jgi:hypothetical protein
VRGLSASEQQANVGTWCNASVMGKVDSYQFNEWRRKNVRNCIIASPSRPSAFGQTSSRRGRALPRRWGQGRFLPIPDVRQLSRKCPLTTGMGGKRPGRFREGHRRNRTFGAWAGFGRNSCSGADGPLPVLSKNLRSRVGLAKPRSSSGHGSAIRGEQGSCRELEPRKPRSRHSSKLG